MRVVHVDWGREMRGGQWQAYYLARGLTEAGHDVVMLARPGSPLFRKMEEAGLQVQPVGFARLGRMCGSADVVHAHDARAHTLCVLAGCRRVVVSRRVAFPIGQGCASRWKYGQVRRFIAVSEHVRQALLAGGVPAERIRVVYDGVPMQPPSRMVAGAIAPATTDPRKGSALAGEAARRAGIELRFSTNLAEDLRDAELFVYLTEEEGLGSGVLLAMSAGVAVVASRVGGLVEVIEDGVNGLLAENTAESVAGCLRRLMERPDWAREMGRRARETVEKRFSLERMVAGTLEAYRGLER
jgi:hypothetical protein